MFGANARLDIGGSLIGSTANSLKFADGTEFRAKPEGVNTAMGILEVPQELQGRQLSLWTSSYSPKPAFSPRATVTRTTANQGFGAEILRWATEVQELLLPKSVGFGRSRLAPMVKCWRVAVMTKRFGSGMHATAPAWWFCRFKIPCVSTRGDVKWFIALIKVQASQLCLV
uniref:Uncharacterized protein n=1 Tax=Tolypothrix bouteillei VB521301 TaxID=1479485 RepID=A0A0C1MX35_9CYAN